MITIANPIYDVVFKYLMEDLKVARIVLSVLIGKRIEQLNPLPQELSVDKEKDPEQVPQGEPSESFSKPNLSVYRLDFAAPAGHESSPLAGSLPLNKNRPRSRASPTRCVLMFKSLTCVKNSLSGLAMWRGASAASRRRREEQAERSEPRNVAARRAGPKKKNRVAQSPKS
jgi:hypothetical protein